MGTEHLVHILPTLRERAARQEPFIALTTFPDGEGKAPMQGIGGAFPAPLAEALAHRAFSIYGFDDEEEGTPPIAEALSGAGAEGPWLAFALFPLFTDEYRAEDMMELAEMPGHVEELPDGTFLCPPVVLAYALTPHRTRRRLWHLSRQQMITETWVDYTGELQAHSEHAPPPWFRARLRRVLMAAEAELA